MNVPALQTILPRMVDSSRRNLFLAVLQAERPVVSIADRYIARGTGDVLVHDTDPLAPIPAIRYFSLLSMWVSFYHSDSLAGRPPQ